MCYACVYQGQHVTVEHFAYVNACGRACEGESREAETGVAAQGDTVHLLGVGEGVFGAAPYELDDCRGSPDRKASDARRLGDGAVPQVGRGVHLAEAGEI